MDKHHSFSTLVRLQIMLIIQKQIRRTQSNKSRKPLLPNPSYQGWCTITIRFSPTESSLPPVDQQDSTPGCRVKGPRDLVARQLSLVCLKQVCIVTVLNLKRQFYLFISAMLSACLLPLLRSILDIAYTGGLVDGYRSGRRVVMGSTQQSLGHN
jgi:hypothetical protein